MTDTKTTTYVGQVREQVVLVDDLGLWKMTDAVEERDGLTDLIYAGEDTADDFGADCPFVHASKDPEGFARAVGGIEKVAERQEDGTVILNVPRMNKAARTYFGIEIATDEYEETEDDKDEKPVVIRAAVGERHSADNGPIALIMGDEHLGVEIDGTVHLFSHDKLRYEGTTENFDPEPGREVVIDLGRGHSTFEGNGFNLSVGHFVCVNIGPQDWYFVADGLRYDGHGIMFG